MKRLLFSLCLCTLTGPLFAQLPTQPVGFVINGYYHAYTCNCPACYHLRTKTQPVKPVTPLPVVPTVKSDSDIAQKPITTTDIAKSIQNSQQLSAEVKAAALATLKGSTPPSTPPISLTTAPALPASATAAFDLLDALKQLPTVKADTDEAQPSNPFTPIDNKTQPVQATQPVPTKESFILMPVGQVAATDTTYEIPATEIGVTVGSKIDFNNSWDLTKPVPLGRLLQFWVKPIGKKPEKLRGVAYTWMLLPKDDYITTADTTRLVLSSGTTNKSYVVILTASYVFMDGDNVVLRTAQAITMVQAGGLTTTPTVPPAADPELSGLARQAYDWTSLVIHTQAYPEANIRIDALKLSDIFTKIADRIKKDEFQDTNSIIAATRDENHKAIEHQAEWLPWLTKMSDYLRAGFSDGSVRTPAQYEAAWRQIARGLKAVGS